MQSARKEDDTTVQIIVETNFQVRVKMKRVNLQQRGVQASKSFSASFRGCVLEKNIAAEVPASCQPVSSANIQENAVPAKATVPFYDMLT